MVTTFLPYPNYAKSVEALDYRRLGKQRVEAAQLHKALTLKKEGVKAGWQNHPAALMWEGFEDALAIYHNAAIWEWVHRGYRNNMEYLLSGTVDPKSCAMPPWFGDEAFHASHRSVLLFKDEAFYRGKGWTEEAIYQYVWPGRST